MSTPVIPTVVGFPQIPPLELEENLPPTVDPELNDNEPKNPSETPPPRQSASANSQVEESQLADCNIDPQNTLHEDSIVFGSQQPRSRLQRIIARNASS
jgi:hypothetical protein